MLTRDDLIDILVAGLAPARPAASSSAAPPKPRSKALPPPGPAGRPFLAEHEIKKRLTAGGKRLTIPSNSILSPLASDWLTLQGIEIVRV
ncbi:MAG: hypothetical protein KGM24_02840 [Elusimicrobia bacterium]|nr:hypothetical protein [Elusimicrobiota bacterium]